MPKRNDHQRAVYRPWRILVIPIFTLLSFWGCASTQHFDARVLDTYVSQERIVRQGLARVPVHEEEWEAIFFGYDRNRDYSAQTAREKGRGIDLLEYKRLRPDGHWEHPPFLILVDVDFDGYVDWVCLDYERDRSLDVVYAPESGALHVDRINFQLFKPFAFAPPGQ